MERLALEQAARTEQLAGRIMIELAGLGKLPDEMRLKEMSEAVMLAQEWCSTRDIDGNTLPTPSVVADEEVVERVAMALSIPQHHTGWEYLSEADKDLFYMQADYALKELGLAASDRDVLVGAFKTVLGVVNLYRDVLGKECLAKIDEAAALVPLGGGK